MADEFGTKSYWNLKKCGEITTLLSVGKEKFFLNCEFCDYSSLDLHEFINHICHDHILNFTDLPFRQNLPGPKNPLENMELEEFQINLIEENVYESSALKDFEKIELQPNSEEMVLEEFQKINVEEIDDKSSVLKDFEQVEVQVNSKEMESTLDLKEEDVFSEYIKKENEIFTVTTKIQMPIGNVVDMNVGNSNITPILVHESKADKCRKWLKNKNKREFIIELIKVYKSLPALWDIKHRDHKNTKLRQNQYDILLRKYKEKYPNAKREEVVRTINILRSTYRRDLNRNYPNGKSTLYYFDAMDFLRSIYVSQSTTGDFSETERPNDTKLNWNIQKGCETATDSNIFANELKTSHCNDITIKEEVPLEQRFTLELIELYRSLPALWNKKNNDFKDRETRNIQYKILLEKYKEMYPDAIKDDLKRTINKLRANYLRESKRPYSKRKLYYFSALSFVYNNSQSPTETEKQNYQDDEESLETDSDVEFVEEERSEPNNKYVDVDKMKKNIEGTLFNNLPENINELDNDSIPHMLPARPKHMDKEIQNDDIYADKSNLNGLHDNKTPNQSRNMKGELRRRKTKFFPPKSILNEAQCLMLADMYKEFPSLWNETDITYRFMNRRQEAFDKMCKKLNEKSGLSLTQENLKKEISRLRKICANEKKEQLLCKREKSVYEPTCRFYDHISYLTTSVHPFECTLCGKIYQTSDKCKEHMSLHDGSRPFKCHMCDRGFQSSSNLTVHLRRHVQDYTYNCDVCNKQCATSTELHTHMRSHSDKKEYVCEICGKEYRTMSKFNIHMHCHDEQPQFRCETCNRMFHTKESKRVHVKTVHLNIRDKICTTCNKAFKSAKNLRQHTQLHAEEKKYQCKLCGKRFAQCAGLSVHVKSHGTRLSDIASKSIDLPKDDDSV